MANFTLFTDGESPAHTAINARLAELEAAILGHNLPVGTIVPFAGSAAPSGWLLCDGSAVSRLTYAALFAIAGVLFGVGNGSTTFNVPDFRGRTAIGAGTGSGLTLRNFAGQVGAETHQLVTAELPAHTHFLTTHSGSQSTASGSERVRTGASTPLGTTGGGGSHNNMQPSLVTQYIVKT